MGKRIVRAGLLFARLEATAARLDDRRLRRGGGGGVSELNRPETMDTRWPPATRATRLAFTLSLPFIAHGSSTASSEARDKSGKKWEKGKLSREQLNEP